MNGAMLALNITPDDFKLAEIHQENGESTVSMLYHYRPGDGAEGDDANPANALKRFLRERRPRSRRTTLVLNSLELTYRDFSFPFGSKKKVASAINFELSSQVPVHEYVVDHIESISREPGAKSFLAAIARKDLLKDRIRHAEEAGLQIVAITADISTLGNFVAGEEEALVMETGERQTLFALYTHGVPVLVRTIPIGMRDILRDAPQLDEGTLKRLAGEIKRTTHSFSAKTGLNLKDLIVTGSVHEHPEVLGALNRSLDMTFIDHPPASGPFRPGDQAEDLNRFASVLGTGDLRRGERVFDFFKDEFVSEDPGAARRRLLRWGCALFLAAMLTILASSWLKAVSLEKRKDFLDSEIRKTFEAAFPQVQRVVDEVRQARNLLDAAGPGAEGRTQSQEAPLLDALREISRLIPDRSEFRILDLHWERGRLEMNGETDSFKTVNAIQEWLSGSRKFSEVNISNAKIKSDAQDVEFKITVRLAG